MVSGSNIGVYVFLLTAGLYLTNSPACAQDNDFRSWNDISFEAELTDDIDLQGEIELRLDHNATRMDKHHYEIELQYKGIKDYDISTGYRFSLENETNFFEPVHRWSVDGQLEKEIKPFDIDFRTLIQLDNFPSASYVDKFEYYLRDKITLTYNIKDFPAEPYFAFEHFVPLNNKPFVITDKNRYTIGADIGLGNGFELDISYRFQRHYDDVPHRDYILATGLKYEL